MSDMLETMYAVQAECELGYPACEGIATEHDVHPTGVALGDEDSWLSLWYCLPCAEEAAWES